MRLVNAEKIEHAAFPNPYPQAGHDREKHFVYQNAVCDFVAKVKNLPTIDPESLRPTAHWDFGEVDSRDVVLNWVCDKCGGLSEEDYPYCPNCGARMEELK